MTLSPGDRVKYKARLPAYFVGQTGTVLDVADHTLPVLAKVIFDDIKGVWVVNCESLERIEPQPQFHYRYEVAIHNSFGDFITSETIAAYSPPVLASSSLFKRFEHRDANEIRIKQVALILGPIPKES
ncbi:hypothetical protein PLUTO_00660 [Luteibacter phage vB_LflM-Pluto]|uniref:Uncharacterized protein n=1 Tax=Luteibacter phage vB_LflM-Pluto TaxID=2948611 RepID=A0A9E7MUJ8_9CAUD|nr:hypothetical protein PLUTO_00660 [Luteibacter phage vB_LflM-Pluto]